MSHSARPADAAWNPSYPQRVHLHQRAALRAEVAQLEARVAKLRSETPSRLTADEASRVGAQMQGAIDQARDATERMPMEVGDLYSEDHHRFDQAKAALARLFDRW